MREARAQNDPPPFVATRSLTAAEAIMPIGNGTSIGWIGWPAIAAVLGAASSVADGRGTDAVSTLISDSLVCAVC